LCVIPEIHIEGLRSMEDNVHPEIAKSKVKMVMKYAKSKVME
jgi:hypothetical protein